jgi:endonuclease YncB( thermonuclease family)
MKYKHRKTPGIVLALLLILAWSISPADAGARVEADTGLQLQGMEISADKADIVVGGRSITLYGVHFPPESDLCGEAAGDCRTMALARLDQWVDNRREVQCRVVAVTTSGTHFAECSAGGKEIGQWLVANGLALADRQVTRRYVRDEIAARRAGVGLWAHLATQFSMVR